MFKALPRPSQPDQSPEPPDVGADRILQSGRIVEENRRSVFVRANQTDVSRDAAEIERLFIDAARRVQ
jgi:hypothetical protein